ncbi:hypothetical protein Esti_005288 [Eimeria stiedai]
MGPFGFIVLAGASLLSLRAGAAATIPRNSHLTLTPLAPREALNPTQGNADSNAPTTQPTAASSAQTTNTPTASTATATTSAAVETTHHTATRIDCLKEANAARTGVGFPVFKEAAADQKLPITDIQAQARTQGTEDGAPSGDDKQKVFLTSVCEALQEPKTEEGTTTEADKLKGIYMYASQTSKSGNCAAAVHYWKEGLNNFSNLPPPYSKDSSQYTEQQNISFVGLYNPGQNPALDCAVITCQPSAKGRNDADLQPQPPASAKGADTSFEPVYSLLCLSTPQALQNNKMPFTQEEWNKITGLGNSSTQPTVFAVVALAVAACVHSLF